ncbi:DUF2441 domain-containing protein [Alkalibacillus sp. S2W]|uniref:DUF2441 domain-containing protein n=1 Tax=Alkalibacillus sp. S2W TaxID=3386553 RepID=UPI00398D003D
MSYHLSNVNFEYGDMIYGMYGRNVQHPDFYQKCDHNYAQYLKEMIFEDYRKAKHPNTPSRLSSVYLIEDIESARKYAEKHNKKYIYEIDISGSRRMLTADMKWMDIANQKSVKELLEIVDKYFNGIPSPNEEERTWETLVEGSIKVISKVESI